VMWFSDCSLSRVFSSEAAAAARAAGVGRKVWVGKVDSRNCCLGEGALVSWDVGERGRFRIWWGWTQRISSPEKVGGRVEGCEDDELKDWEPVDRIRCL
jgi:hypothetical protein